MKTIPTFINEIKQLSMKKILVLAVSAIFLAACTSKPGYKITGKVNNPNLNGQYVYLYEYGNPNGSPIDSALVEESAFIFEGNQQNPELCILNFAEDVVKPNTVNPGENDIYSSIFVLENGNLEAVLDTVSFVSGTPENEAFTVYFQEVEKLNKAAEPLIEKSKNFEQMAENEKQELRKLYNDHFKKRMDLTKNYIENSLHKLSGGYLFSQYCAFMGEDEQNGYIQNADSTFKSVPGVKQVSDRLEVLKKVAIGQKYTDLTLTDPQGQTKKLSDFVGKGKYVLIDFWASWCTPCRQQMPSLKEVYKQFHSKGLEIVGISLDSNKSDWTKGISDLKLPWPQFNDTQNGQSEAAAIYGINVIPQTILINPEGIIVEKNLQDQDLIVELTDLMKK